MLTFTRSSKRQGPDSPLDPAKGTWYWWLFGLDQWSILGDQFWLLSFRTLRGYISVAFNLTLWRFVLQSQELIRFYFLVVDLSFYWASTWYFTPNLWRHRRGFSYSWPRKDRSVSQCSLGLEGGSLRFSRWERSPFPRSVQNIEN